MGRKALGFVFSLYVVAWIEIGFLMAPLSVSGAGDTGTEGTENTYYGHLAGSGGTGNYATFIGAEAGYNETGSDKLYIDNNFTPTPLIWGDFNNNNVVVYGGFRAIASYVVSDRRWKKDIRPLESSLDKISGLQGVSYEWNLEAYPDVKMTEERQIGLIAQDVEKEMPELVSEDKGGYKAVSYAKLTAVLVEAVKELKAQNEKQQAEIEQLRALIKELKKL